MILKSALFSSDQKLQTCLIQDSAHVIPGSTGEHVSRIQTAVSRIDGYSIDPLEIWACRYGESTAKAILAYKTKRCIINRAYQSKPDNIVGKMTIAALDADMLKIEQRAIGLPNRRGNWAIG